MTRLYFGLEMFCEYRIILDYVLGNKMEVGELILKKNLNGKPSELF